MGQTAQNDIGDSGMRLQDAVSSVWAEPYCSGRPTAARRAMLHDNLTDLPGDTPPDMQRDARIAQIEGERQLLAGTAKDIFGDDIDTAPGREIGVPGDVAALHGDIHGRVAHADDDDVLACQHGIITIIVGMHLLCRRTARGREGRASAGSSDGHWPL